jgi:uncharacterized repeat protein (TIGR03809 family)
MTHRLDVTRGRDVVARWSALAEQRLEYLTELFETGRWRRFHSELALLENIQEAKTAVEIWRRLAMREASGRDSALDISWPGGPRVNWPRADALRDQVHRWEPRQSEISAEPLRSTISIVPGADRDCSREAPSAPVANGISELAPDRTIAERYPLLRNAL